MSNLKWNKYDVKPIPIGGGYQGKVYEGYDRTSNKKVAIKKVSKLKHAKRELGIMEHYGNHPNLPEYYDFFILNDKAHIVMELIKGEALVDIQSRIDDNKAIQIIISVLEGLEYLHAKGFLHCDLAPQNIMVQKKKVAPVKIVDFANGVRKGKNGVYKGKKYRKKNPYGPPELRKKKWVVDDSTDLYGVAATCVYLLTKTQPNFSKSSKTHIISLENSELQDVLQKAMNPERKKRFLTAREMIQALLPFV